MPEEISFAVQATPAESARWVSLAQRVEALGFEALCVADHPGVTASPFVALAAAASQTRSVKLGTAVVNTGVREPFDIASDVASLEILSPGRAFLGLGAGHTPSEWAAVGRPFPSASNRISRLAELVPIVRALLAGEVVDHEGIHFRLHEARLEIAPTRPVPLLIGGNSQALVRLGAAQADVVEIGGLGRTLPDGQFHEIHWTPHQIDEVVATFHAATGSRRPRLGALIQLFAVTDDPHQTAEAFLVSASERLPPMTLPTVDELLDAPYVLIGTVAQIAEKVIAARAHWGFTRYTVRSGSIDAIGEVMEILRSTGDLGPPVVA
jgi:probable F420-dependent oxidoreductase